MCSNVLSAAQARALLDAALRLHTGRELLFLAGYQCDSIRLAELTDAEALAMADAMQREFDRLYPKR